MAGFNTHDGCFKTAREKNSNLFIYWYAPAHNHNSFLCPIGFIFKKDLLDELFKKWKELAPTTLIYEKDDIVSDQILKFYFGKQKNNFTIADYTALTNMYTDRFFAAGTGKLYVNLRFPFEILYTWLLGGF